jgi:hypothetical protein
MVVDRRLRPLIFWRQQKLASFLSRQLDSYTPSLLPADGEDVHGRFGLPFFVAASSQRETDSVWHAWHELNVSSCRMRCCHIPHQTSGSRRRGEQSLPLFQNRRLCALLIHHSSYASDLLKVSNDSYWKPSPRPAFLVFKGALHVPQLLHNSPLILVSTNHPQEALSLPRPPPTPDSKSGP